MPDAHRTFLVSFERGEPDWQLLGAASAAELPAIKWREQNVQKLKPAERSALVRSLEQALGVQA
jgi:hypothetical protein